MINLINFTYILVLTKNQKKLAGYKLLHLAAFLRGSNDIANSIAPLATIYHIYENDYVSKKSDVPIWMGRCSRSCYWIIWGYKIIDKRLAN